MNTYNTVHLGEEGEPPGRTGLGGGSLVEAARAGRAGVARGLSLQGLVVAVRALLGRLVRGRTLTACRTWHAVRSVRILTGLKGRKGTLICGGKEKKLFPVNTFAFSFYKFHASFSFFFEVGFKFL